MGGEAWSSLIAVAGTLLGAAVTFLFQRQQAARAEAHARERSLRDERLAASEAFAGALVDFRRGSYDRAHRQLGPEPRKDVYRDEYYRLRSAAQRALLRIRLICDDTTVIDAATHALEAAEAIHDAVSAEGMKSAGELARSAQDRFVQAAYVNVRAMP